MMDPDDVDRVVAEFHGRGIIYCESVPNHEWTRRQFPTNAGFFRLVDAHLRLLRETESYYGTTGSLSYRVVRG